MLLGKEEVIATTIGLWIVGVSPSFTFPSPTTTTGMVRFVCVWYNGSVGFGN